MSALLLTYTPHHERDLREPFMNIPCGEEINYEDPHVFWCQGFCFEFLPSRFHPRGLVPIAQVTTASVEHYQNGTHDDYCMTILFHDRASYRAAHRIARLIRGARVVPRKLVDQIDWIDLSYFHIAFFPEVAA